MLAVAEGMVVETVDAQEDGPAEADVAVAVDVGMTTKVIHTIKTLGIAMAVDVMADVVEVAMGDTLGVDALTQITFHVINGFVCRTSSASTTWLEGEVKLPAWQLQPIPTVVKVSNPLPESRHNWSPIRVTKVGMPMVRFKTTTPSRNSVSVPMEAEVVAADSYACGSILMC